MKSIARTASVFVILLAPAFASAQIPPSTYGQTVTTGYTTGFVSQSGGFGYGGFGGTMFGGCTGNIACAANTILYVINYVLVPVLFAIAFIVFLYGIARAYIFSHGETERVSEGHRLILWGIIGFVVMISLWGLVNVVANTFGLAGYYAPPPPRSY